MPKLKSDDLLARLARVGARSACEVCGVNDWIVIGSENAQVFAIQMQDEAARQMNIAGSVAVPAFVSACKNCGNIRFHAVGVIAAELMDSNG